MHAGDEVQAREGVGLRLSADDGGHAVVVAERAECTDGRVGPAVIEQQLAAALLIRTKVRVERAENVAHRLHAGEVCGKRQCAPRERGIVVVEGEGAHVRLGEVVAARQATARVGERAVRLRLRILRPRNPRAPAGGAALVSRREAPGIDLAVRQAGAAVDLAHHVELASVEAAGGRAAAAGQHVGIERAARRVGDESIHEPVGLVTRVECGLRDEFDGVLRQEVFGPGQHLLVDQRTAHLHGCAGGRVARDDAVEVVGIPLHLHQGLAAAVRTAVKVGVRNRLPVERRREGLACHRGDMGAAIAVVDLLRTVRHPGRVVARVARIRRGCGVAAFKATRQRADAAAQAPDANEVELAVPLLWQADAEVHLIADRRRMAIDETVRGHTTSGRHRSRRRDGRALRRERLQAGDGALDRPRR